MKNLDYTHNFKSWISVWINWDIFEQSFWNREKTEDMLDLIDIANNKVRKVIWINWTDHSNKIRIIDWNKILEEALLLEKWIDWVIITNLNEIKDKISLILWVADCASIAISNKKGDTIWLVHAWWQWTSKDIIWNLIDSLEKIDELSNYEFYIWPMIGHNYEFSENDYFNNFQELCDKYFIHSWKYFIPTTNKNWYLDLKDLIFDLLISREISSSNITFSWIETNSPDNLWPSYRLHTKYKNIVNQLKSKWIDLDKNLSLEERVVLWNKLEELWTPLAKIEKELFLNENFYNFEKDPRIGVFIEN